MPTTTAHKEAKTTEDDDEGTEGTTQIPETVTDPEGKVVLRKSDLEFLEGIYRGKNKESYKKMSDKIYNALGNNFKEVNQQLKHNQLFKAYIKNAHNVSEGISQAYEAMKHADLSEFLRNWYKVEYKPKKGEIKEVEQAQKAEEEAATATPMVIVTTKASKKKPKKTKKDKKMKGKKDGIKNSSPVEDDDELDPKERAKEVHFAAKKKGIDNYSKENLLKDLADEHQKEGVQHMDIIPIDGGSYQVQTMDQGGLAQAVPVQFQSSNGRAQFQAQSGDGQVLYQESQSLPEDGLLQPQPLQVQIGNGQVQIGNGQAQYQQSQSGGEQVQYQA